MFKPSHSIFDIDHGLSLYSLLCFVEFNKMNRFFQDLYSSNHRSKLENTTHFTMGFDICFKYNFFVDPKFIPLCLFTQKLFSLLVVSYFLSVRNNMRVVAICIELDSSLRPIYKVVVFCFHFVQPLYFKPLFFPFLDDDLILAHH